MEIEPRTPFGVAPHGGSPEIAAGKEAIRLAISRVSFAAGTVELDVSASFLFPDAVAGLAQRAAAGQRSGPPATASALPGGSGR